MVDVDLLNIPNLTETRNLRINAVEAVRSLELAQPGIFIVASHIVVGMVTCNDHQRTEHNLRKACFLYLFDNGFAGGVFRLTLNGADKYVRVAECFHGGLHLAVADLCNMRRTVAHKDECGTVFCSGSNVIITGGFHSFSCDGLCNSFLILIDNSRIVAHFAEQRLCNSDALKLILIPVKQLVHLVVLCAVHEMRRLHNEVLNTVCNSAIKRLLHVIDLLIVTRLHVVDDDLSGERAADRPIRVGFLQSVLNALDILYATVVEGRTEADNEQLVFADFVFVARVVFRGVTRIAAEIIRVGVIAFHKLLLRIGQRVPSFFCCFAFFIGIVIALLHIDCVDEIRNILRCHFVCFLLGCARRAAFL